MLHNFLKYFVMPLMVLVCVSNGALCYAKASAEQVRRYAAIDTHALSAPANAEKSIETLAKYLTAPAKNDTEKARAIFSWITYNIKYDVSALGGRKKLDLTPEGVLKSRSSICSGYSRLFQSLGEAVGLEVVMINGYSKGYAYSAGAAFKSTNHAWNAIKINGKWHLLDTTWGAGYINERGRFTRRFNGHYFLTRPEEFIYDHCPEKLRWQLLNKPVSMQQYRDFVYLKPAFFYTGLAIGSHKKSTIKTGDNLTVTLKAPPDTLLMATLKQSGRRLDGSHTFLQREANKYSLHAVFPAPGTYTLRVFAKLRKDGRKYSWALDYKVIAGKGSKHPFGFPKTYADFDEKNGYLFSPLQGSLKSGTQYVFKIFSPGAKEVTVKIGNTWYDLEKEKSLFTGQVPVKKGKVLVMAKYPDNDQYSGLLLYSGY